MKPRLAAALAILIFSDPLSARAAEGQGAPGQPRPPGYWLPAPLVEQLAQYLGQRPLAEVIDLYSQLASCVAHQNGNSAAPCPGLAPEPAPPARKPE